MVTTAPKFDTAAAGSAATAAASSDSVALTVTLEFAGTVTGFGRENVTVDPSWPPLVATPRLYATAEPLVFVIVSGSDSLYAVARASAPQSSVPLPAVVVAMATVSTARRAS